MLVVEPEGAAVRLHRSRHFFLRMVIVIVTDVAKSNSSATTIRSMGTPPFCFHEESPAPAGLSRLAIPAGSPMSFANENPLLFGSAKRHTCTISAEPPEKFSR